MRSCRGQDLPGPRRQAGRLPAGQYVGQLNGRVGIREPGRLRLLEQDGSDLVICRLLGVSLTQRQLVGLPADNDGGDGL